MRVKSNEWLFEVFQETIDKHFGIDDEDKVKEAFVFFFLGCEVGHLPTKKDMEKAKTKLGMD